MKSKYLIISVLLVTIAIISQSCYYDTEEQLYPTMPVPCDTTNVTYSKSILPTLNMYCNSCHGKTYMIDGDGKRFDNYDDVKAKLNTIILSINHNPRYKAMPKNAGKLGACEINLFVKWKNDGALNN
jgi:hypothetical protein